MYNRILFSYWERYEIFFFPFKQRGCLIFHDNKCFFHSATPSTPLAPVPVGEVEILLIICAIMFLALLLVGMACSYTCLKKRNIKLVRRRPMSLGAPSDITKMSGSTLLFDGVKIPRAHATCTSDSDTALVSSETLPSDYPSDPPSSGSEVEEIDIRSVERRSSAASSRMHEETIIQAYQNQAFVLEEDRLSSVYSEAQMQSDSELVVSAHVPRPPVPSFLVRVKRAPTPPRTPEPDYPVQLAHSQSLTTIAERDESFRAESLPGSEHAILVSDAESLLSPPTLLPPPEYAQTHRKRQFIPRPPPPPSEYSSVARSVSEHDLEVEVHQNMRRDLRRVDNVELLTTETTDIRETVDRHGRRYMIRPPPSEPDSEYPSEARSVTDVVEEMPVVPRRPDMTTHMVDDRHMSTITETHTTEDVERHRRFIKQVRHRPGEGAHQHLSLVLNFTFINASHSNPFLHPTVPHEAEAASAAQVGRGHPLLSGTQVRRRVGVIGSGMGRLQRTRLRSVPAAPLRG